MRVSRWSSAAATAVATMLALAAAPASAAPPGEGTAAAPASSATEITVKVEPIADSLATGTSCLLNVLPTLTKSNGRVHARLTMTMPSSCSTQTMHLRLWTSAGTVKNMAFTAIPGTRVSVSTSYPCNGSKKTVWRTEVTESLQVYTAKVLSCGR